MFGYPSVPQMAAIPQQLATQPNAAAAPLSSTEMNLMLTDGRLKHTEIKADLNRIIDKVDSLSSKIGNLENSNKQLQTTSQSHQQIFSQAPEMEASTIMLNITRIIKVMVASFLVFKYYYSKLVVNIYFLGHFSIICFLFGTG